MIRIYGFCLGFCCIEFYSNGWLSWWIIDKEILKYLRRIKSVFLFDII